MFFKGVLTTARPKDWKGDSQWSSCWLTLQRRTLSKTGRLCSRLQPPDSLKRRSVPHVDEKEVVVWDDLLLKKSGGCTRLSFGHRISWWSEDKKWKKKEGGRSYFLSACWATFFSSFFSVDQQLILNNIKRRKDSRYRRTRVDTTYRKYKPVIDRIDHNISRQHERFLSIPGL